VPAPSRTLPPFPRSAQSNPVATGFDALQQSNASPPGQTTTKSRERPQRPTATMENPTRASNRHQAE
jgi:hypothetical protein